MTILSILWTVWFSQFQWNDVEEHFEQYENKVLERVDELYKKALIWVNWRYSNNTVNEVDYINLYCDNSTKTFKAYICDDVNADLPLFNNCKEIDFPTLENIKYGTFLSTYRKVNTSINECMYKDIWSNIYTNATFYIKISTNFPNGKTEIFWYKGSPNIYERVSSWKINLKEGRIIKEVFPLTFK